MFALRMGRFLTAGVTFFFRVVLGLTLAFGIAFGIIVRGFVVDMVIIVAFLNLGERRQVFCTSRTYSIAKYQLNVVRGVTLAGWNIRCLVWTVTGMKGKVVVKSFSADWREIYPNFRIVRVFNRVSEVDFVFAVVDAIRLRRDLDGNTRVGDGAVTPWFFVAATRLYGNIFGMRRADLWDRPDVDVMRTVVGDDSLSLSKSHEGAKGEAAARHDARRIKGVLNMRERERMDGVMMIEEEELMNNSNGVGVDWSEEAREENGGSGAFMSSQSQCCSVDWNMAVSLCIFPTKRLPIAILDYQAVKKEGALTCSSAELVICSPNLEATNYGTRETSTMCTCVRCLCWIAPPSWVSAALLSRRAEPVLVYHPFYEMVYMQEGKRMLTSL